MICGDPSKFAIESIVSLTYGMTPQKALGNIIVFVGGKGYGNRAPDATTLGFPLEHARARIRRRGRHTAPFFEDESAEAIADALLAAEFDGGRQHELFFGLSASQIRKIVGSNNIDWAADVDESFDDGSHVFQFDIQERVRLIGCVNAAERCVHEVWLLADDYYQVIDSWQKSLEDQIAVLAKSE